MSSELLRLQDVILSANTGLDAIQRAPIVEIDTGIKCLRIQDISQSKPFDSWGFTEVSTENFKKFQLKKDDILIARTGGSIGVNQIVDRDYMSVFNNGLIRLRVDCEKHNPLYVYYLLQSEDYKSHIYAIGYSTAAQPNMKINDLLGFQFQALTKAEEDQISNILKSLDDRIALLRETNATLEAIAQALFKSWFVDFDPVHANAGTQAPSLPAEIQALFPSRLVESPQGLIPEGWEWVSLKEATQIFDSKRIPLSGQDRAKRKGPYPYYGAASLMDWVDDFIFDGIYLLMGEDGSVADKNGFPIIQYVWGKIWVNNHAHVLQGKNGISTEHLMLAVKGINIQPYMTGAVQAKLSQSNMWRIQFLMPTKCVAEAFAKHIEPLFTKIRANSEQAITLENLRDALLPRLISGQLRLPEAEAPLAEVG